MLTDGGGRGAVHGEWSGGGGVCRWDYVVVVVCDGEFVVVDVTGRICVVDIVVLQCCGEIVVEEVENNAMWSG